MTTKTEKPKTVTVTTDQLMPGDVLASGKVIRYTIEVGKAGGTFEVYVDARINGVEFSDRKKWRVQIPRACDGAGYGGRKEAVQ